MVQFLKDLNMVWVRSFTAEVKNTKDTLKMTFDMGLEYVCLLMVVFIKENGERESQQALVSFSAILMK